MDVRLCREQLIEHVVPDERFHSEAGISPPGLQNAGWAAPSADRR